MTDAERLDEIERDVSLLIVADWDIYDEASPAVRRAFESVSNNAAWLVGMARDCIKYKDMVTKFTAKRILSETLRRTGSELDLCAEDESEGSDE